MSMKTNNKVKKSRWRGMDESQAESRNQAPTAAKGEVDNSSTLGSWILKMNERTENVYENKGPRWKTVTPVVTPAEAGVHLAALDSRFRGNDGLAVARTGINWEK